MCASVHVFARASLPRISFVSGDLLCRIRQKGIIRENISSRKKSGLCGKCYDIGSHIICSSVVAISWSWEDVFIVPLQITPIIKTYQQLLKNVFSWFLYHPLIVDSIVRHKVSCLKWEINKLIHIQMCQNNDSVTVYHVKKLLPNPLLQKWINLKVFWFIEDG